MNNFDYPCPECRTTSNLHKNNCNLSNWKREQIEAAYTDILSELAIKGQIEKEDDGPLIADIENWSALHDECLQRLLIEYIVVKDVGENEVIRIVSQDERKEMITEPMYEPLKTIYQKGTVQGCHDNGVFAMIAFYQMVGLDWEETKEKVVEWLEESGAWDRGGFAENSPEELVSKKRHVYNEEYGWKEKAEAAKRVIDKKL